MTAPAATTSGSPFVEIISHDLKALHLGHDGASWSVGRGGPTGGMSLKPGAGWPTLCERGGLKVSDRGMPAKSPRRCDVCRLAAAEKAIVW